MTGVGQGVGKASTSETLDMTLFLLRWVPLVDQALLTIPRFPAGFV